MLVYEHLKTVKSKLAENFISRPLIEILDEMDLLTGPLENRLIKNVAAIMFCEHPEKFFPVTQVDIVIFPEGSIENPDLMIEAPRITGPVPRMIKDALSYLRTNVIKKKIAKILIARNQTKPLIIHIRHLKNVFQTLFITVTINSMSLWKLLLSRLIWIKAIRLIKCLHGLLSRHKGLKTEKI